MKRHFLLVTVALAAVLVVFASHQQTPEVKPVPSKAVTSRPVVTPDLNFGKFPLYFIANKGQVDKRAVFYAKASRYTLWLTKEGLVFDSFRREKESELRAKEKRSLTTQHPTLNTAHRDVSRLLFVNARKNPEIVALDETKLRVNYFKGNDPSKWRGDIPTSGAVLYKGLYSRIDLKVYGLEKQIEYDWIVKPGGDPGDILFEYKNAEQTRLDKDGNLLITTSFGELIHKKPIAYQNIPDAPKRIPVDVTFKKIKGNTYGFEVGEYDKDCELIIDPVVLAYSTYLGGGGNDSSLGIAVYDSGYAYMAGSTDSGDFPIMDQYQDAQGGYDVFVTKIDTNQPGAAGLIYSTYLGGSGEDYNFGIAIDGSGCAYVTGRTLSTDFPTLNPYQENQPGSDAFATKLDTNISGVSSLVYSTYLGGSGDDRGFAIAVDNSENAYVTGSTCSTDFPVLDQYQDDQQGCDAFVTKIDTNQGGASGLIYSTYLGGEGVEEGNGIAVDNNGNAYVTGQTLSTDFPVLNQYQNDQTYEDAFVAKIDTTLSGAPGLVYSTYLGGGGVDVGTGIAVDSNGYAYVTGYTFSTDFPTLNQYQTEPGDNNSDVFVTKIDTTRESTSSLTYSTYLGGIGEDKGYGIAVDCRQNAYVTGSAWSTDFPTLNQYQTNQPSMDAFVTRLDTLRNGVSSLIYSTYLGGGADECGRGIAVDVECSLDVYISGWTGSTNFPTLDQFQSYTSGINNAFVTKLFYMTTPTVTTAPVLSITTTSADCGGDVTYDGGTEVTARGVCWSTSPDPTTNDDFTTDGSGTGTFDSSLTNLSPNTLCYVRAYATNSIGTAYGHAELFETAEPSITVTSPGGGETWEINSQNNITWTSQYIGSTVKIEYSTDGGGQWNEITASTAADGTHPWTVPAVASDQYLIKISDNDSSTWGMSGGFFSIIAPSVTVTSPNGGEIWTANSQHDITWTSTGTVGNVKLEYSTDNGDNWTEIIASTPNDGSHPWSVPAGLSNQCRVRVSDTGATPTDTSDNVFSIVDVSSVTVVSPNGGETLYAGSVHNIMWTSAGSVGDVKIEYSTNNGSQWSDVIGSTENDGSYAWTVPGVVSVDCLVRVSETDGSPSDSSDNLFTIQSAPVMTVTSPNGGENLEPFTGHTITWAGDNISGNVMIQYSLNGGNRWRTIAATTENDGSYNWTVPDSPSDTCLVRVSAGDPDGGLSDVSDAVFSIVPLSTANITVTSPNGGEQLPVGSSYDITWTATGVAEVPDVVIEYSTDRGDTWSTIVTSMANAVGGNHNWTVPNTPSTQCLVRIRGTNGDGAPSDSSDRTFTIPAIASPGIVLTAPNGGETWMVNAQHTITWETAGTIDDVFIEYTTNNGQSWMEVTASTPNTGSFNWDIPATPSADCRVRVTDADGGQLSDQSDDLFTILDLPTLTVTAPNGGEHWNAGTSQNIKWASTGSIGDVTIHYSADNGDTWTEIVSNKADDGLYDWLVPDTPSSQCLVRISGNDLDTGSSVQDESDAVFAIDEALGSSLMLTSPNGGEDLFVGGSHQITWFSFGSVGNVDLAYSTDGGDNWNEIAYNTENDGSHDWTVPDAPSGACLVRVSENGGGALDIGDGVFNIFAFPDGEITVTAPDGGETWEAGSTQEITWTDSAGSNAVTIQYSFDNGASWVLIADTTTNDGSYDWTVPHTPSDNSLVRVRAKIGDWDGGPSDTSDAVFSIFVPVTPVLRVVFPNGGETWTAGSTQTITWNSNGNISDVAIAYSTDNGGTWDTITASTPDDGTYDWSVPDTPSEECLVRISADVSGSDDPVSDVSDAVFSIVPEQVLTGINVLTPNGGESLYVGDIYDITWTTDGVRDTVTIEYSTSGGDAWSLIAGAALNNGRYEWTVPDEPSDSCLVRISETNGPAVDISDAVFSIVTPPAAPIEVLEPNGGEVLDAGADYDITWTSNGVDSVIIEFSSNNGGSWQFVGTVDAVDGMVPWTVPDVASETCLVRVSGNDGGENPSDVSDAVFTIQSQSASLEVLTPNGGESLGIGGQYNITWLSSGIQDVIIYYSVDSGDNWKEIDTVPALGGRFTWTVPDDPSDACLVRVRNAAGETPVDESDAVFTIE